MEAWRDGGHRHCLRGPSGATGSSSTSIQVSIVIKEIHPKEAIEKCREGGEQLLNQLAAFALGMQCCGTVPVPTFDMLRFPFRLLASYGSGSVSLSRP